MTLIVHICGLSDVLLVYGNHAVGGRCVVTVATTGGGKWRICQYSKSNGV